MAAQPAAETDAIVTPALRYAAHVIAREYALAWGYMGDAYRLAVAQQWCLRNGEPPDDAVELSHPSPVSGRAAMLVDEYLDQVRTDWTSGGLVTVEDARVLAVPMSDALVLVSLIAVTGKDGPTENVPTVTLTICRSPWFRVADDGEPVAIWQVAGGHAGPVKPGLPPNFAPGWD